MLASHQNTNANQLLEDLHMMKFFSGATAEDIAAKNQSTTDLGMMVKQYLSIPENLAELEPVLNSESDDWLDTLIEIDRLARNAYPGFAPYSVTQLTDKVIRRLNANNKASAIEHKFQSYAVLRKGKLKEQSLAIEHKPEQQDAA